MYALGLWGAAARFGGVLSGLRLSRAAAGLAAKVAIYRSTHGPKRVVEFLRCRCADQGVVMFEHALESFLAVVILVIPLCFHGNGAF